MSIVRNFVVGMPAACGVPEGLAKWDGERNGGWYDWERDNPDGALRRVIGQTDRQRLDPAFTGWEHLADAHRVEYAKRLLAFAAASARFNQKDLGNKIELDAEGATLRVLEPNYPTISALMTVEQASTLSNWA